MNIDSLRKIGKELFFEIGETRLKPFASAAIGKGAGGDKTFPIDKQAEDIIITGLENLGEPLTIISEEAGTREIMPGGKKPYYQSALLLRVYGKNVIDKAVSAVMPVKKEVSFVVQKHKIPILSISSKFEMATQAHGGLQIGQCDDAKTIKSYLEAFGDFTKGEKGGWLIYGDHYPTQSEWKTRLYSDAAYGKKVRGYVIATMVAGGELIEEGGAE